MSYRDRRGRRPADPAAPRRLGCVWLLFWLVLAILVLALAFGGYRKGTKITDSGTGAPAPAGWSSASLF